MATPLKKIQSKTGNATIVKQGHTTDRQFGSNPDAKGKGRKPVTDLNPK